MKPGSDRKDQRFESTDPYVVLGVSRGASPDDIKRAFRALMREHHPDFNGNDPRAHQIAQALNDAYRRIIEGDTNAHPDSASQSQPPDDSHIRDFVADFMKRWADKMAQEEKIKREQEAQRKAERKRLIQEAAERIARGAVAEKVRNNGKLAAIGHNLRSRYYEVTKRTAPDEGANLATHLDKGPVEVAAIIATLGVQPDKDWQQIIVESLACNKVFAAEIYTIVQKLENMAPILVASELKSYLDKWNRTLGLDLGYIVRQPEILGIIEEGALNIARQLKDASPILVASEMKAYLYRWDYYLGLDISYVVRQPEILGIIEEGALNILNRWRGYASPGLMASELEDYINRWRYYLDLDVSYITARPEIKQALEQGGFR